MSIFYVNLYKNIEIKKVAYNRQPFETFALVMQHCVMLIVARLDGLCVVRNLFCHTQF